jgi:hypothetical protein
MIAITVGAYRLVDFVRLNIAQCQSLFPDSPILISDDLSEESDKIRSVSEDAGCSYICSNSQRGHTAGDFQSFVNGAIFARDHGMLALKLSQRFVPALPQFHEGLLNECDHDGDAFLAVLPSRLHPNQVARPGANFYLKFGHLTDCVLWDPSVITGEVLQQHYNTGYAGHHSNLFSELAWDRIRNDPCFPNVRRVDWLANHEPMKPKLYLRKAGSTVMEYADLAAKHGIKGDFNLGEWKAIMGRDYKCVPRQLS